MNISFPPIRQFAFCPCGGILDFHIIPFSNGRVGEYCPRCHGKELGPVRAVHPAAVDLEENTTPCKDCGAGIRILRQSGRKKERCPECKKKWQNARVRDWKIANSDHVRDCQAEYRRLTA